MSADTVADRRVHPGTIALRFIKEVPSTVLALPAGLAIISDTSLRRALLLAAAAAVVMILYNWIAWRRFRYGLGARDLVIESGILNRTRRSIPFDRIQDVDIERAPLARLFGLAKVRIETGAGGKDEGVLDSVTVAEADRLRAAVRAWRLGHAAVEGEVAPVPESQTLFAMDVPRVLMFGLFSFSLVYIAGLFAILQTFENFLPFDIYDPARWVGLVGPLLPGRFTIGAIAALLLLASLLGVAAGILRTLSRDFGFRLSLEGDRFRRERGLFTRSEVVIARKRVQLAHVQTGPVRRLFGWFGLSFQTLGGSTGGGGHQSAAPFARMDEVEPILDQAQGLTMPVPADMQMVSRRHLVRALAGTVLPPLVAILAASVFWPPALLFLGLVPLFAGAAMLERRFHLYGLVGGLLFVRRGLWRQQLWIVPVRNAQAFSLTRSFLQRRLGLASLAVDTAGARMTNYPRIVDLRLGNARALVAELSARRAAYASGRKSGTER